MQLGSPPDTLLDVGGTRYARAMPAQVNELDAATLSALLPDAAEDGRVYVLPTRPPSDVAGVPRYTDTVRYLPKLARAHAAPVEFATPADQREFISEFSVGPDAWALGLAFVQMANDWIIWTITAFYSHRAEVQGYAPEQADQLPLKVSLVETSTRRSWEIEGTGAEVIEVIQALQLGSDRAKLPADGAERE